MKKLAFYSVCAIIIIAVMYHFLGEQGLFGGILGTLVLGSNSALNKLKEEGANLDKKADKVKEELKLIDEDKKNLKVEDMTPEEEAEYWRNND